MDGNHEQTDRREAVQMTINCNDLIFDICMNQEDLMGIRKLVEDSRELSGCREA